MQLHLVHAEAHASLATMAARVTRVASGGDDDASRSHLLELSHDGLGVIFDGLADPLEPVVAVALSSTCLGLRTPLRVALEVLKERHEKAKALCRTIWLVGGRRISNLSCAGLAEAEELECYSGQASAVRLTANDFATLGMLLPKWLPRLLKLTIYGAGCEIGDTDIHALFQGLDRGAASSLRYLNLGNNPIGPAGASTFAAAINRGGLPMLETLYLHKCVIGEQGIAALTSPLRKLPALKKLALENCKIGDEGVASLVANLGKDDFMKLEVLMLSNSALTEAGGRLLVSAVHGVGLPSLKTLEIRHNDMSPDAEEDLKAKLGRVWPEDEESDSGVEGWSDSDDEEGDED